MPERITDEEMAHLERLFIGASEHLARGHFGPADIAGRLGEAEAAVPRLIAEVRRLRRIEEAARAEVALATAYCGKLNAEHDRAQAWCRSAIEAGGFCVDCPAKDVLLTAAALEEAWAVREQQASSVEWRAHVRHAQLAAGEATHHG